MESSLLILAVIVAVVVSLAHGVGKIPTLKGKLGEWQVKTELRRALPPDEYTLLHNVTIPSREGTTQIDHVVLSRFGIFVIETKNMSGWIFGNDRDSHWTQTFRGPKLRFQNPLHQNYAHVRALETLLGLEEFMCRNCSATNQPASPWNGVTSACCRSSVKGPDTVFFVQS